MEVSSEAHPPSWPGLTRPPNRPLHPPHVWLGPRVKPGDDGGGAAIYERKAFSRPQAFIRRDPDIAWHYPRGTRASARLHPGAGRPRLVRQSLADAIGSAGPRPQRACPTAPFGTGGDARPGAPTRLQPGGGRSVQPPPTPSGTEGPAAWPVRAAPGEVSGTTPARPAGSRPPPFRPRPISGDPDTPISPAPAVRRDLAFGEGDGARMGPNEGAGISFADRRGDPSPWPSPQRGEGTKEAIGRG